MTRNRMIAAGAGLVALTAFLTAMAVWALLDQSPEPGAATAPTTTIGAGTATPAPASNSATVPGAVVALWPPITPSPEPVTFGTWESRRAWLDENVPLYPSPSTSERFGAMPARAYQSGGGYVAEFSDRIFNLDFARDDREEFLAWVVWETAPFKNEPGFHATDAERAVLSAAKIVDAPNSQLPLTPDEDEWDRLADLGATQQVRNVAVLPDPSWQKMLLEGPPETHTLDPNSDCVAVTATVDRIAGTVTETKDLYYRMCVGTAMSHSGLGFASAGQVTER